MNTKEWLETDGLGGFASGSVDGIRSRRYHALLLTATTPPTGRFVLVNGFDAWVETDSGKYAISSQRYTPDVLHPDGTRRIESFAIDPWPSWTFLLDDGTRIQQQIFVKKGSPLTVLSWQLLSPSKRAILTFRPFLSGRDYHSMHHENGAFRFTPEITDGRIVWQPYSDVPRIVSVSNATYTQDATWYRNFLYEDERLRGLDFTEDLASPGFFQHDLSKGEAIWILTTDVARASSPPIDDFAQSIEGGQDARATVALVEELRTSEMKRRKQFSNPLERAATDYIVDRKKGKTIVAGYPWFTDWGRDTFIALRGLCLTTGMFDVAREILLEWAGTVSEGMLPNRFPDQGGEAEYNSVDASLWYIIAVHDFVGTTHASSLQEQKTLQGAVEAILTGYEKGTRYGIRMDEDGLLAAGVPGVQLTWMDAKIGDWVVTPRIGKPVEIQALWLNALWIGSHFSEHWGSLFARGSESFKKKFWNEQRGYLYDVIDVDHQPGKLDDSFRPNQIFAVGGLPVALLDGEPARRVVESVETQLLTPLGLRSLAPASAGYAARYAGGPRERDSVYHQGTVWPWLIGPFLEAWIRVHGESTESKTEARTKFLEPILQHLHEAGLNHISEVSDAESPYTPGGCPFQAWSLGEVLRSVYLLSVD